MGPRHYSVRSTHRACPMGSDTFHAQPRSPWTARSLFALARCLPASAFASAFDGLRPGWWLAGWLPACNVATRSVPLRHVAHIVVPFFLPDGSAVPVFVPTEGAPLRKFRFRRGVPSCRVALRRAQINRSSKGASTLFCRSNEKLRRQPCPSEKEPSEREFDHALASIT